MKILAISSFLIFVLFTIIRQFQTENPRKEVIKKTNPAKKIIIQKNNSKESKILSKTKPQDKNKVVNKTKKIKQNQTHNQKRNILKIKNQDDFSNANAIQDHTGDIYISNVIFDDGFMIAHGDIIVGKEIEFEEYSNGKKALKLKKPVLWKNGTIPYSFGPKVSQSLILSAMDVFKENSNIKFIKRSHQADFVYFQKGSKNCYSNVGKIGGKQIISLSEKCERQQIIHELIHTIGFLHEQNRMDRDEHIKILWENIEKRNHLQFQIINNNFLNLSKFSFDFDSIMLYGSNYFSKFPDDYSMVKRDGLPINKRPSLPSSLDWKKINYLYPDS